MTGIVLDGRAGADQLGFRVGRGRRGQLSNQVDARGTSSCREVSQSNGKGGLPIVVVREFHPQEQPGAEDPDALLRTAAGKRRIVGHIGFGIPAVAVEGNRD
ncbi:MAG: hypothetical protein ACYTG0_27105 [Planctomycetota bacterium]